VPKFAPQQEKWHIHHKKEGRANIDEKIEYARSVFLNARRPHIKNDIGYKSGDKHNSRVNSNGKEFIIFTKGNSYQDKKQRLNNTNHPSYANASYVSHMSYYDFNASYILMRNKFGRVVALYVEPHHKKSKTCVWVPKCLVTNIFGYLKTRLNFVLYDYSGGRSWVLDSGCTNHMTGENHMFTSFEENDCPSDTIMFGDNSEGRVLGYDKIAITTNHSIFKVLLVDSLDYNLLSVSQLCEMDYNCLFTNKGVTVFKRCDSSYIFSDILKGKLYLMDSNPKELELDKCLIAKINMG
jgi:hypothetical protein